MEVEQFWVDINAGVTKKARTGQTESYNLFQTKSNKVGLTTPGKRVHHL